MKKRQLIMLSLLSICAGCTQLPERDRAVQKFSPERGEWTAADGKELTFQVWDETDPQSEFPPTVWVAVHGLGGGSDEFAGVARFLNKHNAIVIAPDLRGMGLDPVEKNRGDIQSYREWILDLEEFISLVSESYPERRLFLHGESLGAVMNLYVAKELSPGMVSGMVLCAPVIHFRGDVGFWKMQLFRFMRYFLPGKRFPLADMGSPQEGEERLASSRDPEVLDEIKNARARLEDYSIRLLYESGQLIQNTDERVYQNKIPLLILYAGQDVYIRSDTMEEYLEGWQEAGVPLEFAYFPTSHHLLTRDLDREEVFSVWLNWWKRQSL